MQRPGVMAPPDLYDQPRHAGLMSAGASPAEPPDLRFVLWSLATALAAVELVLELAAG